MADLTPLRRGGLALAGIVGALLTIYPPLPAGLVRVFNLQSVDGVWLGLAMGIYLALVCDDRLTVRTLALPCLSLIAFLMAYLAALPVEVLTGGVMLGGGGERNLQAASMIVGGAVGAFALSVFTFYLYIQKPKAGWRAALACGIAGGVLGAVGHALGDSPRDGVRGAPMLNAAVYMVWQLGVTLMIGLMWPAGDAASGEAEALSSSDSESPSAPSPAEL